MDLAGAAAVPFPRLVKVELRKSYDTRAGFWLLVTIVGFVLVMLAIATIITLVESEPVLLGDFASIAAYMTSFLLPILAIMLVTSEWTQRSALSTFTLEPRRHLVIFAKLVSGLLWLGLPLAIGLWRILRAEVK
jgi:ABC-2 type transport system permease protein